MPHGDTLRNNQEGLNSELPRVRPYAHNRKLIWPYLKDVALLSVTSVGGPQVHIGMFSERLVRKGNYLSESELMELYGLCQILPGPSSTQTLTAVSFRLGGPWLAWAALLLWITPAVVIMTLAALYFTYLSSHHLSVTFLRFMVPVAIGFLARSAYVLSSKVIISRTGMGIMMAATAIGFFYPSPFVSPLLIIGGGITTGLIFRKEEAGKVRMGKIVIEWIQWADFVLFFGILLLAALAGNLTGSLPIRLFENFYRNGSIIFGGGNVLVPLMFTEFVEFKHYLSQQEFLSGFALVQALPGPVFALTGFVGALSMRGFGLQGQLLGSLAATAGIFLPGTLLIFFFIRFWVQIRHLKLVKAGMEGINAAGAGLMTSATLLMLQPYAKQPLAMAIVAATLVVLYFNKLPGWTLLLAGLAAGLLF